ncbi:ATP synthase-coupling factor 6, mitochondrial [Latimeria chalumnae]|uniref:ATP synthase-coupling factor 6, mitochondrial n=1 Tax=Latimeria chalumnae TaxID=7897 RepID=UPI0003C175FE|nr:PREDICTED: ATP synthase-coupling factor 6, mitochondrial [Latimeria chalumnae]XP_006003450.1 PREDICTED: ATP synthase-coupling factor 6, mitochondrial [Latimeria chalumnae]|eukprot:XP_006003449.1 PREDICTED: ATP synthase-coupling factor 6, mitochondrial [Latimeria chalumnae]
MILQRLFHFSSVFRSAVGVQLRRNIGLTAIAFNKTKELDPVQKLFVDKIREYATKGKQTGGLVDAGPEFEKDMNEEVTKLQRWFGASGEELIKFPDFKFEELKLEDSAK